MYEFWFCLLTLNQFSVVTVLIDLSNYFSTTLVSYEAAPPDGLPEHYGYCSQEPQGVKWTVLQHTIMV